VGLASSITGTSVFRGGGGAGSNPTTPGVGGNGGGGNQSTAGTANTGGGGGGASGDVGAAGAAGGSGVVIISYRGNQRAVGGTVTTSGGFTIHTFNTSGNFVA
jgi:hypothetical protein